MNEKHLEAFCSFLRFASVSADEHYASELKGCAEWLTGKLNRIGVEAELIQTKGHPIVWGRTPHDPNKRTIVIYGHYDVQPPDPLELWKSPPFEPLLKNGRIFARGASDNKGQVLAHILGVEEALRQHGELPVNVQFIIEGEEEIGSPSLSSFFERNRNDLLCEVAVVSDGEMLARGVPTLTYGLRGLAAFEVKLTAAKIDLHSGLFGGAVANPITALAHLLATLHDREGRIAVEGFYDRVATVERWEYEAWESLPINLDDETLRESGATALFGEKGFSTTERLWARPTVELNGIQGGYQGTGTKTVLPSFAKAKLTCRLVPNQRPDEMIRLLKEHLREQTPCGVELDVTLGHTAPWYRTNPNSSDGRAAQSALREVFGGETALVRSGGTLPIVSSIRDILGAETLLVGLGLPDNRIHSPNENFAIENLEAGVRLNQVLLQYLA